jgi:hypothetical protein
LIYTELFNTVKTYCENEFPSTTFTGSDGVTSVTTPSNTQINTFITQAEKRIYNSVQIPVLRKNVTGTLTINNPYLSLPFDFLSVYSLAVYTQDYTTPYTFLLNKDVNFIREAYPVPTSSGTPKYYAIFGTQFAGQNAAPSPSGYSQTNFTATSGQTTFTLAIAFVSVQVFLNGVLLINNVDYIVSGPSIILTTGATAGDILTAIAFTSTSGQTSSSYGLSLIMGPSPDANYLAELHYFYYPESIVTAGESWLGNNYDPILLYGALLEAAVFMKAEADTLTVYKAKYDEAFMQLKRLGDGLERGDAYRDGQLKINVAPKGGVI